MTENIEATRKQQEANWLADLERLGPEIVRSRLANRMAVTDFVPYPEDDFVRRWLDKKVHMETARQQATIRSTLRWARVAGWASIAGVVVGVIGIAVAIWLAK